MTDADEKRVQSLIGISPNDLAALAKLKTITIPLARYHKFVRAIGAASMFDEADTEYKKNAQRPQFKHKMAMKKQFQKCLSELLADEGFDK